MKRHMAALRASIFIIGIIFLFVAIIWLSMPTIAAPHPHIASGQTHRGGLISIQETPTVDPTVTALEKEKLVHGNDWWWNYGATVLTAAFSTLALLVAGLFGIVRWFGDRRAEREKQKETEKHLREDRRVEREKRDEERFQAIIEGLGSSSYAMQAGTAILLRTFLHPDYGRFYNQAFDLAVANLRLRNIDPNTPEPLNSLSQALITVFKESFPLTRDWLKQGSQVLDAARAQLDNAYLAQADLRQVWMPEVHLRKANLSGANLREANLSGADLSGADLSGADLREMNLSKANLSKTNLSGADLNGVDLNGVDLNGADLRGANLSGVALWATINLREAVNLREANLSGANLWKVDLSGADLRWANLWKVDLSDADLGRSNLSGADLREADLHWANLSRANLSRTNLREADLSGTKLDDTTMLTGTMMHGVKGLTKEQLEACKVKGALIEDTTPVSDQLTGPNRSQIQVDGIPTLPSPPAQEGHPSPGTIEKTDSNPVE